MPQPLVSHAGHQAPLGKQSVGLLSRRWTMICLLLRKRIALRRGALNRRLESTQRCEALLHLRQCGFRFLMHEPWLAAFLMLFPLPE